MSKILQGMKIIAKYEDDPPVAAKHDDFWYGATHPSDMSPADVKALEELGWSFDLTYEIHMWTFEC